VLEFIVQFFWFAKPDGLPSHAWPSKVYMEIIPWEFSPGGLICAPGVEAWVSNLTQIVGQSRCGGGDDLARVE
jgi:hypothetical protein